MTNDITPGLQQLSESAREMASECGLQGLSNEPCFKSLEAKLQLIKDKGFPVRWSLKALAEHEMLLNEELTAAQQKITEHRERNTMATEFPFAAASDKWLLAAKIAVTTSLVGVGLATKGVRADWLGVSALLLCGVWVFLHWQNGSRLRAWAGSKLKQWWHTLKEWKLLRQEQDVLARLEEVGVRRIAEKERERQAEVWLAQTRNEIFAEFEFYFARGTLAAQNLKRTITLEEQHNGANNQHIHRYQTFAAGTAI